MRFVVFGTGGVGGYFGGKLAQSGEDVWFIARGDHLVAMQQHGLTVNANDDTFVIPPGKMTDIPGRVGKADVILFCVKSYDTESAAVMLAPMMTKDSIVISLQNGVDNEQKIQIPVGSVFGGVAYIYASISAPGIVTVLPGPRRIIFGPLGAADERGKPILDAMLHAGIAVELTADIRGALWKKFIFISAVAGITTLSRLTLGEILGVPETRTMLADAMKESETIALKLGITLDSDFIGKVFTTLSTMNNNSYSSMHYDFIHGKPLEIEALSGTVVRYGERLGIPTPTHKTMYAALLPHHLKHLKKAKVTLDTSEFV